ncbi:Saccharopine dehydrogenase-like oxidoreductase [Cucumispora dikerogammari]|nr:Saccharopine dehydrogenase-like oxidoreductase [Cucumispora dikerogammari]
MNIQTTKRTKKYDVMVYGASGFTAKFVVSELTQTNLKVILGGRNKIKIVRNLESIPRALEYEIFAGEDAIKEISEVRLVLNCAGPFSQAGKIIIKACLNGGTNYMDICGEPAFMQNVNSMSYEASKNNVSVIQACGFDSTIADFGYFKFKTLLNSRKAKINDVQVLENETGELSSKLSGNSENNIIRDGNIDLETKPVPLNETTRDERVMSNHVNTMINEKNNFSNITSVIQFDNCKINRGTWNSLLESFYNAAYLARKKKSELIDDIGGGQYNTVGKKKTPLQHVIYSNYTRSYWVAFMGSDISVVRHSQKFYSDPSRYAAYMEIGSRWKLFLFYLFFFPLMYLSRYSFFKNLFCKYFGFFSCGIVKNEPDDKEIKASTFKMTFFKDYDYLCKEKDLLDVDILEIKGPDPGYKTTPIVFVECAKKFLELEAEHKNIVGVVTPAMMFKDSLIKILNDRGIKFRFK